MEYTRTGSGPRPDRATILHARGGRARPRLSARSRERGRPARDGPGARPGEPQWGRLQAAACTWERAVTGTGAVPLQQHHAPLLQQL